MKNPVVIFQVVIFYIQNNLKITSRSVIANISIRKNYQVSTTVPLPVKKNINS